MKLSRSTAFSNIDQQPTLKTLADGFDALTAMFDVQAVQAITQRQDFFCVNLNITSLSLSSTPLRQWVHGILQWADEP
jgi:hypothetical protein